jgi:hypothetical protein
MSLNSNPFVEGIDPTGTFGGFASVLLQLIRQAQPSSTYGMLLYDTTTPDVSGSNAWRKRCIWVKPITSPASVEVYLYRTAGSPGWINIFSMIPNGSITTDMIADAAVTLAKLSTAGGTANQLIRVNASATGFEFVNFADLVTANSLPASTIRTATLSAGEFYLLGGESTSGGGIWYTIETAMSNINAPCIDVSMIMPSVGAGTQGLYLRCTSADTQGVWGFIDPDADFADDTFRGTKVKRNTVPVNKLIPGSEGQILVVSGGVPAWSSSSPITPTQFREDFVFATGNFNAASVGNVDISLTLPSGRTWKDIELDVFGDISVTNFGVVTLNFKWQTAPETGLLGVSSTAGCGTNTYSATGTSSGGTTFSMARRRWVGLVPSTIAATNITIRLELTATTFAIVTNSHYAIRARATANS